MEASHTHSEGSRITPLIWGKLISMTAAFDEDSHSLRFLHAAALYNALPLTIAALLLLAYQEAPTQGHRGIFPVPSLQAGACARARAHPTLEPPVLGRCR